MASKESKFYVKKEGEQWSLEHEDRTRFHTLFDSHAEAVSEGKRIAQNEANLRISGTAENKTGEPGWVDEETRVDTVSLSIEPEGGGTAKTEGFQRQSAAQLTKAAEARDEEIKSEAAKAEKEATSEVAEAQG